MGDLPGRASIRIAKFDYSQPGCYFITICAFRMRCLFGRIQDARAALSPTGFAVRASWIDIPRHYPNVDIDAFVVMPNHFHGIVVIKERARRAVPLQNRGEAFQKVVPGSIPTIIRSYKSAVTRRVRADGANSSIEVWQSNYFERVIRDGAEFSKVSKYIHENPAMWHLDVDNPARRGTAPPCPSGLSWLNPPSLR
jgi:REP-associated tyrosine transposase